jgi:hypothetical protein
MFAALAVHVFLVVELGDEGRGLAYYLHGVYVLV